MDTLEPPPFFACDDCAGWVKEEHLNHVRKLETLEVGTSKEVTKVGVRFICKRCVANQFGGCDMYVDEKMVPTCSVHGEDWVDNYPPMEHRDRIGEKFYSVWISQPCEKGIGSNGETAITSAEPCVETRAGRSSNSL